MKFKVDRVIQALELEENPVAVEVEKEGDEDVAADDANADGEDEQVEDSDESPN
ncbi:hypothetical protein A2U01_0052489, partial [Trifolium medium]|nr:hypothetical protein [Trifolium medium]